MDIHRETHIEFVKIVWNHMKIKISSLMRERGNSTNQYLLNKKEIMGDGRKERHKVYGSFKAYLSC